MNYYISDMHLGHANVLRYDARPFSTVEEMDEMLLSYWNMCVQEEDHVYVLGDFCYKSRIMPESYLRKLKGHKHLIVGNHDGVIMKRPVAQECFESIDTILRINDNERSVVMCHYPIADWEGRYHGTTHLYGHIHGNDLECAWFLKTRGRAYNAAACINHYKPCKLEEIIANNDSYLRLCAVTEGKTGKVDANRSVLGWPRYGMRQPVKFSQNSGENEEMVGLIGIRDTYGTYDRRQPSYDIWGIHNDRVCLFKHIPETEVTALTQAEIERNSAVLEFIKSDLGW